MSVTTRDYSMVVGGAWVESESGKRFEATSPFLPGVTRRFASFRQAAEEAGLSRVYGGIHFRRAVMDGSRLGTSVGRDVSRLLPPVRR